MSVVASIAQIREVCQYQPAGNTMGAFEENVLPLVNDRSAFGCCPFHEFTRPRMNYNFQPISIGIKIAQRRYWKINRLKSTITKFMFYSSSLARTRSPLLVSG